VKLTAKALKDAVENDAAIRRVQKLQPVGGKGDKIFPPTYPPESSRGPARHVFETRRVEGKDVRCVLIDSVQSQANRLEEALLKAARAGIIELPYITVDFVGQKEKLSYTGTGKDMKLKLGTGNEYDLSDLGVVTSLDAPHRVFDAIIRDSDLNGKRFTETEEYKDLLLAKPTNALPVFKLSPTALIFGAWNSTGEGGGVGAKFTRCVVSEIVGFGASDGWKTSSRIDPLGIRASVKVVGGRMDWTMASANSAKDAKRPSEINHSNITPSVVPGGVTIDYALHTMVISCPGLRRLRFPGTKDEAAAAARAALAALTLTAVTQQDVAGYALRSRCDLAPERATSFEIIHSDGSTEPAEVSPAEAIELLKQSVSELREYGLPWSGQPLKLVPQKRLVELVAASRAQALEGESDTEEPSS
jgi:CRISPR-associated protein Csb1